MPNLNLLLVIFLNVCFGSWYAIFAAVLAGTIKDSFSVCVFGTNLFSSISCACMIDFLKRYIYHAESRFAWLLLVFFVTAGNIIINVILRFVYGEVDFVLAFKYVFLPEMLATLIVSIFIFRYLKRCALKFFV